MGCTWWLDTYRISFDGSGSYGYGGTVLGYTDFSVEDSFSGGQSTSKRFRFTSTRGVKRLTAEAERYYFSSARPEGRPVSGGATYRSWGPYGPYVSNVPVTAFESTGGYIAYEGSVASAGIMHQFSWTDPSSSYPGRWYAWWKSAKFQRQSSGQYTVTDPPPLPAEPYGSGYSPS